MLLLQISFMEIEKTMIKLIKSYMCGVSLSLSLSLSHMLSHAHTHTHTHTLSLSVCVCACAIQDRGRQSTFIPPCSPAQPALFRPR